MKVKDPKDCVKLDRAIFSSHINPTGSEQATYRKEIIRKTQTDIFVLDPPKQKKGSKHIKIESRDWESVPKVVGKASKGTALLRSQHGKGTDSETWVFKPPRFCCVCCLKREARQIQNHCFQDWTRYDTITLPKMPGCIAVRFTTMHYTALPPIPRCLHPYLVTYIHLTHRYIHTQMHTYPPLLWMRQIYIRLHPYTWRSKESGHLSDKRIWGLKEGRGD